MTRILLVKDNAPRLCGARPKQGENGGREVSWEAAALVQARDTGGLARGVGVEVVRSCQIWDIF